jgi:hypothetical protein
MQRDMDLFRKIALHLEKCDHEVFSTAIEIDGYTKSQICYHCELMKDAGFIAVGSCDDYDGDCEMLIFRLSHRGHDFIDSARSESVWQNAQTQIGKTIGGASLQVLMQLLINYGQTKLGLPTT